MGGHWLVAFGLVATAGCRFGFDPTASSNGDGQVSMAGSDDGGGSSAVPMDAPRACTQAHQTACTAAGGVCDGDSCTITVGDIDRASCPAMNCKVICGANRCSVGADLSCAAGGTCDFECKGANSCVQSTFTCAGATCDLHCNGANSCAQSSVDCTGGTCVEHCCGNLACSMTSCSTCGAGTCP